MSDTNTTNLNSIFDAKGLVVVISGGATGLGLVIAKTLTDTGAAKVYILGRRLEKLQEAAKSIDSSGNVVIPIQCDVTDPASVRKVADQVEKDVGYVDVLVNNAGVSGPKQGALQTAKSVKELADIMLDDWDSYASTHAVNASAVVGVSAAFLPLLDAGNQKKGWQTGKMENGGQPRQRTVPEGGDADDLRTSQVVTVASIAAYNRFITASLPYASSKAGAVALSKALANLLAPWGIRFNAICPGVFPSEMTQQMPTEYPFDKIPAGRQGVAEEMASTILYLVGKGGAYLNGAVQVVDGGRLSVMPATY